MKNGTLNVITLVFFVFLTINCGNPGGSSSELKSDSSQNIINRTVKSSGVVDHSGRRLSVAGGMFVVAVGWSIKSLYDGIRNIPEMPSTINCKKDFVVLEKGELRRLLDESRRNLNQPGLSELGINNLTVAISTLNGLNNDSKFFVESGGKRFRRLGSNSQKVCGLAETNQSSVAENSSSDPKLTCVYSGGSIQIKGTQVGSFLQNDYTSKKFYDINTGPNTLKEKCENSDDSENELKGIYVVQAGKFYPIIARHTPIINLTDTKDLITTNGVTLDRVYSNVIGENWSESHKSTGITGEWLRNETTNKKYFKADVHGSSLYAQCDDPRDKNKVVRSVYAVYQDDAWPILDNESTLFFGHSQIKKLSKAFDVNGTSAMQLTVAERLNKAVSVESGKKIRFSESKNTVDTTVAGYDEYLDHHKGKSWGLFVLDPLGNLYIQEKDIDNRKNFHHSSFLQNKPVAAAGEIIAENGTIKVINSCSGHYLPDISMIKTNLTKSLSRMGYPANRLRLLIKSCLD